MKVDISPPKQSHYQGIAEQNIGLLKELLAFEPQRNLHILEIQVLMKKMFFILNCRPIVYSENDGCIMSRMDLLSLRNKTGTNMLDSSKTEKLLDEFWERYRQLTLEDMLKIEKSRFTGEVTPEVEDIVAIPDKLGRAHGICIGEIEDILPSHDNEKRVCKVRMARKSGRNYPQPYDQNTCKQRVFTRGVDKLIFLLRRKPKSNEDRGPFQHFLYEDLVGKPYLNEVDEDGGRDDNKGVDVREEVIEEVDDNNDDIEEDDDNNDGIEEVGDIKDITKDGEKKIVKLKFYKDDEMEEVLEMRKKRGRGRPRRK